VLKSNRKTQSGQAAIEMALALPFLIWLLFYTFNAFHLLHTAHVAQKYAAMSLYDRIANRAKFVIDEREGLHNREFMAVRYTDENGRPPVRKILVGPATINTIVGICREPVGICSPN
jgi:hypothetical protein